MSAQENFVVDWQDMSQRAAIKPYVALRLRGRQVGLYRVRAVGDHHMLLDQKAAPLPVAEQVEVGDVQGLIPNLPAHLVARIVSSDRTGLNLAW